jgi:hypothetical protein
MRNEQAVVFVSLFYSFSESCGFVGTEATGSELDHYSFFAVGGPMTDTRDERLQIMLSPDELTALDDFRFKHRMPTRAAAVRELLRLGLTVAATDGDGRKSSNYGVFSRGGDGHRESEGA